MSAVGYIKYNSVIKKILRECLDVDENIQHVEKIGDGRQSEVFKIVFSEKKLTLAIKVYKCVNSNTKEILENEYKLLKIANELFCSKHYKGWKFDSPKPYLKCEKYHSIIMYYVDGVTLSSLLCNRKLPTCLIKEIAHAVANGMMLYWHNNKQLIGDVNLNNIICDIKNNKITFIDLGIPNKHFYCAGIEKNHYPESRDIGYFLFETCILIVKKRLTLNKGGEDLEKFIEIYLDYIFSKLNTAYRVQFLSETIACASFHEKRVGNKFTLFYVWHKLLKYLIKKCIFKKSNHLSIR